LQLFSSFYVSYELGLSIKYNLIIKDVSLSKYLTSNALEGLEMLKFKWSLGPNNFRLFSLLSHNYENFRNYVDK